MPRGVCGLLKRVEPGLGQRVDRDDLGAALLGDLERGEHARMVGAGVLADDHEQVGLVDVLERDAALADADRLSQRRAARLVAHVRAVRQVVGAVGADERLVEERRLVAGAAGGVEDRLDSGESSRLQVLGDDRVGLVPGDRAVVVSPGARCIGSVSRPSLPIQ